MSFYQKYRQEIIGKMKKKLGLKNTLALPRIEKIVINVGFGSILNKSKEKGTKRFEEALAKISGQKPVVRLAKKSISNFKLRQGMPIGASVTLRGKKMFDFLERFILITIPRIRDFRGFPRRGDGKGNVSIGIKEHNVFPEIGELESFNIHGIGVTIVTTAKNNEEVFSLLEEFNFPFKK